MSFLNLSKKSFLITGVSNKKSVAYFTAKTLLELGSTLYFSVQNEEQQSFIKKHFPDSHCYLCDVSNSSSIKKLAESLKDIKLNGMLHSIAFARFSTPHFHETNFEDFSEATRISAYSLIEMSNLLKHCFVNDASIVTVSISNLRATNYGFMGPIKAMLKANVDFLAKSFSHFSRIRFNSIAAGPLKTSASAGIPKYLENYLYCEELTLRKENLKTQEVANTITFLLSHASSGINASEIVIDAGMNVNYFEEKVVDKFTQL